MAALSTWYNVLTQSTFIKLCVMWLAVIFSGCAYNYAGQESKPRSQAKPQQDAQIVTLEQGEDQVQQPIAEPEVAPEYPCVVKTLDVQYYDATSLVTRTIDCQTKQVVNVARVPMGETTHQERREEGLPEGRWYFLVDPTGTRANYPNNAALLKVSQIFKIEFYGRESSKGLLVYLFLEELG